MSALITGLVVGPLDLIGQMHTPYPFANLFNSLAVWAAVAFGFGFWARSPYRAAVGAVVACALAVETYHLAAVLARLSDITSLTSSVTVVWLALAVGAGIIFGTAGATVHHHITTVRIGSAALLPSVFASETAHQVIQHFTTAANSGRTDSLQYAGLLGLVAVASFVWLAKTLPKSKRPRMIQAVIALTSLGLIAYQGLTSINVVDEPPVATHHVTEHHARATPSGISAVLARRGFVYEHNRYGRVAKQTEN